MRRSARQHPHYATSCRHHVVAHHERFAAVARETSESSNRVRAHMQRSLYSACVPALIDRSDDHGQRWQTPLEYARQGVVMALTVGELAPEISVPSSWGNTFTLSEAVKENVVVLTFYFFAFTGG